MDQFRPDVGCYYFPGYHADPRMEAFHGPAWTEWELVAHASPRYSGHRQPRTPLWGPRSEADPDAMAQKIDAAADHGIDYFIFDWYWYENLPFLEAALNDGFLQAPNADRMRFALMWANHDWVSLFPAKMREKPALMFPGTVSLAEWATLCDHVVGDYFASDRYYRIDGRAYFSVYDTDSFFRSFGGPSGAALAIDAMRERALRAGVGEVHVNAVAWKQAIVPREGEPTFELSEIEACGFDSITSYVWIHHARLGNESTVPYDEVEEQYHRYWKSVVGSTALPYYPNVSVGWDSTPRTVMTDHWDPTAGYPYTPVVEGASPQRFRDALERVRSRALDLRDVPTVNINSWNEWTEGSYLEPDTHHGFDFLEAVRDVFGTRASAP